VKLSREFVALNLAFARHVEHVWPHSPHQALWRFHRFTRLYRGFGLTRDFDPVSPVQQAYLAGSRRAMISSAGRAFYCDRQTAIAPAAADTPDR
jgi:hypothetical protein